MVQVVQWLPSKHKDPGFKHQNHHHQKKKKEGRKASDGMAMPAPNPRLTPALHCLCGGNREPPCTSYLDSACRASRPLLAQD
jgi:hypothetical protein